MALSPKIVEKTTQNRPFFSDFFEIFLLELFSHVLHSILQQPHNGSRHFVGQFTETRPNGTTGTFGEIGNIRHFVGQVTQTQPNGTTVTGILGDIDNGSRRFVGQVTETRPDGTTRTGTFDYNGLFVGPVVSGLAPSNNVTPMNE